MTESVLLLLLIFFLVPTDTSWFILYFMYKNFQIFFENGRKETRRIGLRIVSGTED